MANRIAGAIVRLRVYILVAFALIAVASAFTVSKVRVNYDFAEYLADDTLTKKSLELMKGTFGDSEQLRVMFTGRDDQTFAADLEAVRALDGVLLASYDPEAGDRTVSGVRYQLVNLSLEDGADGVPIVESLRSMFAAEGGTVVSGSVANTLDIQQSLSRQISVALAVSVAVALAVLLATSRAWAEPFPILLVLALAILVNMGTNWVFGTISFVTFAVCAILQLALSMDYAIMLLHMFDALKAEGMGEKDAMVMALTRTFMPISSSALTTVAGFLSLLFMSFTIGFDIGIVLSKGILISMLTVFFAMPALVLAMPGILRRTAHKPLNLGGARFAAFARRGRWVIAIALLVLIGVSFHLQTMNDYLFIDVDDRFSAHRINEIFGSDNMVMLLVPSEGADSDYEKQKSLVDAVASIEVDGSAVITSARAMVTTGAAALKSYAPEDVAEMLGMPEALVRLFFRQHGLGDRVPAGELAEAAAAAMPDDERVLALKTQLDQAETAFNAHGYTRMLFTLDLPYSSEATYAVIGEMLKLVEAAYGGDFGIVGSSVSSYDISRAFTGDLLRVNLLTAAALILIIAISFRSLSVPVLLVCVIQGAIWVTMAASYIRGEPIFFMSYLICVAMQMGATIDYGILLTSHYRAARKSLAPAAALSRAVTLSLPTILTSGLILVTAGFIVGKVTTISYVSSIGLLLSRGAAISIFMILVLLPTLIAIFDRFVKGRASNPPA